MSINICNKIKYIFYFRLIEDLLFIILTEKQTVKDFTDGKIRKRNCIGQNNYLNMPRDVA